MEKAVTRAFKRAWRLSIPVAAGYLPVGLAIGVLLSKIGASVGQAFLQSLVCFAGSAQLLSVKLMERHAGLFEIFVLVLILNLRHVFYGLSMLNRYAYYPWYTRTYLIHTLTDETFAVISAEEDGKSDEDRLFCIWISFFDHFYWVFGTLVGAILESQFHFEAKGLEFVLTALFVVLIIEQWKKVKTAFPFLIAIVTGVLGLSAFGEHFLVFSMGVCALILIIRSLGEKPIAAGE